ncbi:MAG: TIGR03435 family protein [Vicinamibacterales bacterium]
MARIHIHRVALVVVALPLSVSTYSQAPAIPPSFEVVSIKRNKSNSDSVNITQQLNGAFSMVNGTPELLIGRAFGAPDQVIALPSWARSERYDVIATVTSGSPTLTVTQRRELIRGILVDRFRLRAHVEKREQASFDLVVTRPDKRLGPRMRSADAECLTRAASGAAESRPMPITPIPPTGPVPRCRTRMTRNRIEGDATMATLAALLGTLAGQPVIDKTGLSGYYQLTLDFEPARVSATDGATLREGPSLFTSLQEQLGLRLERARILVDALVIDELERPTDN